MKVLSFKEIQVYEGIHVEGGKRIAPEDYGLDVEHIQQNDTPASYAQALFDELWKTGKFSANAFNELLANAYAYGVTWGGGAYYLGACRDFVDEK